MASARDRILHACLFLLEESSSDSSSSSDDEYLEQYGKSSNEIPKISNFTDIEVSHYSDNEFRKIFRMNIDTFKAIVIDFQQSEYFPKNTAHGGRPTISAENHVLSFLWYAGNQNCIRDLASRFGIGEGSLHRQLFRVMDYLVRKASEVIKFPEFSVEKKEIEKEFRKVAGFPGVLGSIDESYINIRTPANKNKSAYINYHDSLSITLQGICDAKGRFIDVFTGTPSKIHDSRVLKLSLIFDDLPTLCNDYHILGDVAYPLREWLITPYRIYDTYEQKNFNKKLSATRISIEKAFRILKQRFRHLLRLDFHSMDTNSKFILACCVLHNTCINMNDEWEYDPEQNCEERPVVCNETDRSDSVSRKKGEEKRNKICQNLQRI